MRRTGLARTALIWAALGIAITTPLVVAAFSPLHAWRSPVYIAAGFAGIIALALLLVQPLLAGGYLPRMDKSRSRYLHRWVGIAILTAVVAHVAGLWITSPPDVIDALLFVSPTPFSLWGVIAMWALFATALLAALRPSLRLPVWRLCHTALALVIVGTTVAHALLIEGTMGTVSKAALCMFVVAATLKLVADRRAWAVLKRRKP